MYGTDRQDRWKGAVGAAVLVAGIGYGLVAGLNVHLSQRIADEVKVVAILPEAPPPRPDPVPAPKRARKRKEGAASPPNRTSHATELVAPSPVIRPPAPPPVAVAIVANTGSESTQGAAPVAGPGTGSGGVGTGTGSGRGGNGDGGGGGEVPLRLIHGQLRYKDLPRDLIAANAHGIVGMHFDVDAKGRVTDCRVTATSGNRALDLATCDLIRNKLRYRPTIDAGGHPRADYVDGEQQWDALPQEGQDSDDRPRDG